jgi:acetyl esterase/lipase
VSRSEHVLDRWAPPPTTTVRYGALPEHVADIWGPAGPGPEVAREPVALALVVHGGFWRADYDRTHTRPMCNALAADGLAVAAIEFRRTGMAGGGWPGTFDDVRAAVETVPELAAGAVGRPLGPVVLIGHSAGGQLVLWAGSRCAVTNLAGVISLAGVCDLVRADELHLGAQSDDGAVAALLGGSASDQPDRYAAADPMRLPLPDAPVVLIHGDRDTVVPVELSHSYAARDARIGLVELPGVDHFAVIDPLSPAWTAVRGAVADLLDR